MFKLLIALTILSPLFSTSSAHALGSSPTVIAEPVPGGTPPAPERKDRETKGTSYCLSCHEMEYMYEELMVSPHANKATCYECHKAAGVDGMLTNLEKAWDHFITKNHSTREEFDAGRLELAQGVWKQLERERFMSCRQCHNSSNFGELMKAFSVDAGGDDKLNCTECHKGVAHRAPEEK